MSSIPNEQSPYALYQLIKVRFCTVNHGSSQLQTGFVHKNSDLFKLFQFDFILQIGICWNVVVCTATGSICIPGFDFQQWLLTFLEFLNSLFHTFDNSNLRRLTDHNVNISVLKYVTLMSTSDVNCSTHITNINIVLWFLCAMQESMWLLLYMSTANSIGYLLFQLLISLPVHNWLEMLFTTTQHYASTVYAVILSVCPSATSRYCTKTAWHRITETCPWVTHTLKMIHLLHVFSYSCAVHKISTDMARSRVAWFSAIAELLVK